MIMHRNQWCLLSLAAVLVSITLTSGCVSSPNRENVVPPGAIDVSDLSDADYRPFVSWLQEYATPPVEYVIEKFAEHDVVILGEIHEIRENCELIADLIDPLYHKAGVRYIAMEALKHKHSALANQLVTGGEYDEDMALQLFRNAAWPIWGFKEYMDIPKAVWAVNKSLPPSAEKMKVVGLDCNWDAYKLLCGWPWSKIASLWNVLSRDKFMAKVLTKDVIAKNGKALVQIGYAHSYTHYRLPVVRRGKLAGERGPRFGVILTKEYGDRIFQICLHQWHFGPTPGNPKFPQAVPVLGGLMEKVMEQMGNMPLGFDTESSPFAMLRDQKSMYFAFQKYVVFSDIAQGYIFLKPLKKLTKVAWVKGFICESNFKKARAIVEKRKWIKKGECATPEELDARMPIIMRSP